MYHTVQNINTEYVLQYRISIQNMYYSTEYQYRICTTVQNINTCNTVQNINTEYVLQYRISIPFKYLVIECNTISAPSDNGRYSNNGIINKVLLYT